MQCPFCNAPDTKVIDSRLASEGSQVRRRRECLICEERFNTHEVAELTLPFVIKSDDRRENFDPQKLRVGLERALEKRPVAFDVMDTIINHIKIKARSKSEREVSSHEIGEWVMEELRQIDAIAYVRFASVYRHFQDIDAFNAEIQKLQETEAAK
jgi:transcriptional repressor NrdR